MKKAFRIILVIVIALAVLIISLLLKPAVPHSYETGETGGTLEKKYLAHGTHDVSFLKEKAMQSFGSYEIWYPSDLKDSDDAYPVIVVSNGTGVRASKAKHMFEHFASWGFIVIGNEEEYSWNGFAADMSLTHLLKLNEDSDSVFYRHVDTAKIGALGHSQGGVGTMNAATVQEHASLYKTIAAESPTAMDLADALEWSYDPALLQVPALLLASDGSTDENTVIPLASLQKLYDTIPSDTPKVMARRTGVDHSNMLYCADGYVTAWFLYWLCDDEEAGSIFRADGELTANPLYEDVQISSVS